MAEPDTPEERESLERERNEILLRLEDWLEWPMLALAFVWLALLILEFTYGLSPFLARLGIGIWIVFVLDFLLKLFVAPRRLVFVRRNWLTVIALIVPALRVFRAFQAIRVLRAARAVRGLRLVRVVSSINRGMRALGNSLSRRGFGYVIAITVIVIVGGGAGMYTFEGGTEGGINSYPEALWWTAMLITSIGSDFWPATPEGRLLCLLLSIYGLVVFGYITATLASFFISQDADDEEGELAGSRALAELRKEVQALRADLARQDNSRAR